MILTLYKYKFNYFISFNRSIWMLVGRCLVFFIDLFVNPDMIIFQLYNFGNFDAVIYLILELSLWENYLKW